MTYLEPLLPLLLAFACIGLIRSWRKAPRGGKPWLAAVATVGITLLSLEPVAWLVSRPLESAYPVNPLPPAPGDAIVVLAAGISPAHWSHPYALPDPFTYTRFRRAAWLHKQWMPLPVLAVGGVTDSADYAESMRHILESEGVPRDHIEVDTRSNNTHDNAVYAAELLRRRGVSRIVLIVDALSMSRAAASFRRQGITVAPAPSSWTELEWKPHMFVPGWRGIRTHGEIAHEVLGLCWYWWRGWI